MKKKILFLTLPLAIIAFAVLHAQDAASLPRTDAPEGARAYIISPKDGKTVPKTFVVRFGLKGMGVAPAGVDLPNTGHHHLLVDVEKLPPQNLPIPADDNHRHFGGGQTEAELTLPAGTHTLQLLLADKNHVQHKPPIKSKKITITVE